MNAKYAGDYSLLKYNRRSGFLYLGTTRTHSITPIHAVYLAKLGGGNGHPQGNLNLRASLSSWQVKTSMKCIQEMKNYNYKHMIATSPIPTSTRSSINRFFKMNIVFRLT